LPEQIIAAKLILIVEERQTVCLKPGEPTGPVPIITIRRGSGTGEAPF